MTDRPHRTGILAALALMVAACSGGGSSPEAGTPAVSPSTEAAAPPSAGEPSAKASATTLSPDPSTPPAPTTEAPVIDAAWAQAELTDVASGETFRIAELAGKVVIVETMAIWCPSCLSQQADAYAALDELEPERVAYVLLDVDPSETQDALAAYRSQHGFTGTYAIAGRDVARALAEEFGDQVLNPPSTPMILIGTDGRVTLTDFGHKSPDTIVQLARDHGA